MSCIVGHRHSSHPTLLLLWLWCRLAATALIWTLAWELPYAAGEAKKRKKRKKKKKKKYPDRKRKGERKKAYYGLGLIKDPRSFTAFTSFRDLVLYSYGPFSSNRRETVVIKGLQTLLSSIALVFRLDFNGDKLSNSPHTWTVVFIQSYKCIKSSSYSIRRLEF